MGLENLKAVDIVSHHPETDAVRLTIVQDEPWGDKRLLLRLQEKINNYLSFVLDGQFYEMYPAYRKKPVEISLFCQTEPDRFTKEFLNKMREQLKRYTIGFSWRLPVESKPDSP